MKNLLFLIFAFVFLTSVVSSCKKDENTAEKFSTLSVEENKALVEVAGTDYIKVMSRMRSVQTIDVLVNLGEIMSAKSSPGFFFSKDSKLSSTFGALIGAAKGGKDIKNVFDALVSSKELKSDPESIKDFWDSNVGTYTWNGTLSDWDIVLGGTKFIFYFPSSDIASTNDAIFTISNYTGINISNPIDDEYTGDLPLSLNADLKVGSKTLITIVFAASYNTDGIPKAIAADLVVESYKFEVDISNDTKIVSATYKFLENDNVVMDMSASGEGLFTEANYNASTTTHTETNGYWDYQLNPLTQQYEDVWVTYTDTWDETDFEEIINSANASFQLFNIALRGDINIKGLVDQINLIDKDREDETINQETAQNRISAKINEFMNLRLVNVTSNEIIAKAESYVVKDINYDYTDYYINFKLKFGDDSLIDLETYFDSGFDSFVGELNDLIYDINSEYDLGIDPVVY